MKPFIVQTQNERGSALILAVGYLAIISIFATAFVTTVDRTLTRATEAERRQTCLALAEAGIDKALAELRMHPDEYRGESNTPLDEGCFSVEVTPNSRPNAYRIVSTGELTDDGHTLQRARVTADVVLGPSGSIRSLLWSEVKK